MMSASKSTIKLMNLKILRSEVTKKLKTFCEFQTWYFHNNAQLVFLTIQQERSSYKQESFPLKYK
jgi:hypothetical protein